MRWVSAAIVLTFLLLIIRAFAVGQIDWDVVGEYFTGETIIRGFRNTLLISSISMVTGLMLGIIFAIMRLSKNPVTNVVAWLYVWIFRGTPLILQLLIWFNIALVFPTIHIPGLINVNTVEVVTPFVAACLGLAINEGAYMTEVVRAGIQSVDRGQGEAAMSLGMSPGMTLRRIILPQAMRLIIPPVGNSAIGMLKTSSLAAVISYSELLNSAQQIYFVNGAVIELLFVCAIWYIAATTVLSGIQFLIERNLGDNKSSSDRQGFRSFFMAFINRNRATVVGEQA
jgi:polar amino acid transport system permease protein